MRGDTRAPKRCHECQDDAYIVAADGVYRCARCFGQALPPAPQSGASSLRQAGVASSPLRRDDVPAG
jgi:ribosomal protein L37AE/L43A